MITIDLTNTNPMIMTGEATTSQQTMYFRPDIVFRPTFNNVCSKFVNPVCYLNKVFGNISDLNNDVENDQTSFLFSKVISTDVVAMELWSEEDGKLADLIDDTYGTFYDVGFSSIYPLYFGYRIHWGKVLNAFGSGHYYLKVVGTFIGEATSYETQCFYVLPFSNCNADGTVRIKWFQDGDIGSNSIKYAGLNWENWIRIPAIFWNNEPTEEIDEIEYTSRKFENVQIRSIDEFSDMMLALQRIGCQNINVVTPTHYSPHIVLAIDKAASKGLTLPLVYNTCGWERVDILKVLDGIVDMYLPDFKFSDGEMAAKYSSGAGTYADVTKSAILEMHRQVGVAKQAEDGLMYRGLMIRHLVMPNNVSGTKEVIEWIANNLPNDTYLNLMSQYRPMHKAFDYPEISRRITQEEYTDAINWAKAAGLTNLDIQGYYF